MPDLELPSKQTRKMGVTVQELDAQECERLKLAAGQGGLRVDGVHDGGAAAGAGVKAGDVILSVAGVDLPRTGTREKLREVLNDKVQPGRDVPLVVLREGGKVELKGKWSE